ncbi:MULTISPECIES: hypothetical protein [Alphaproteobacteria]|uniref:hypothetical protein n=1 Tax=Sphingopyxis sp. TaxID=1908224 RepID=UPI004033EB42
MTQKPAPTARQPADAATAFEDLRREISLQRTAIEGLTSAKDKLPDYSPTLREILARLDRIDQEISDIKDRPAMRLTPGTIAAELASASLTVGAEDRKSTKEARDALIYSLGRADGMIKKGRSTEEQNWWVTWGATGGFLGGTLLTLISMTLIG